MSRAQDGTGTDAQVMEQWRQRALEAEEVVTGVVEDRDAYANTVKWITEVNDRYREALEWIASSDMECGDCMHCAKHALDGEGK